MSETHDTPEARPIKPEDLAPRPDRERVKAFVMLGAAVVLLGGILLSSILRRGGSDQPRIVQAPTQPAIEPDFLAREAERELAREARRHALEERRSKETELKRRLAEQRRLDQLTERRTRASTGRAPAAAAQRFTTLLPGGVAGRPVAESPYGLPREETAGRSVGDRELDETVARAVLYRALAGDPAPALRPSVEPVDATTGYQPDRAALHRPPGVFLRAGTAIPATLLSHVISGRAGPVQAVVTHDVYATGRERHVLIPAGTRLLGFTGEQPTAGDRSLAVAWQRLLYADGSTLMLERPATTSGDGAAGLHGRVDNHWPSFYFHAFLTSVTGAVAQLSQPGGSTTRGVGTAEDAAAALGRNLSEVTREVARRQLQRSPTIEVLPGSTLAITLLEDLLFAEPPGTMGRPNS